MAEKEKQMETAPDPDEDDLDDLDDVLDEFNAKPKAQPAPSTSSSLPSRPPAAAATTGDTAVEEPLSEEDLAKQLESGMKNLVGELGEDPEMQKKFEEMMQELIAAGAAPSAEEAAEHVRNASDSMPKEHTREGKKEAENFQDTIRRTMERMQASGDAATAASTSGAGAPGGGAEEELLAQMMRELGSGAGGDGSGANEEDFNKMLLSMMSQLTNKEILYEPMKELDDKFPAWLEKHRKEGDVGKEGMERYEEQAVLVREIVGRFEREGYRDEDEGDREFIVERMQKMQAAGSPPPDLVGDMSAAQEALGDLDQGCPTQ